MKNLLSSSYTGRAPRNLEAAFGPYQRRSPVVALPDAPMDWQDKVVVTGCTVAAVGIVCMLALGWIV